MPFTPFHMGPGLAIKAIAGRHFSLMIFGFSQVAIDLEPLVRILRGDVVLHGFTHTYVGATLVALGAMVIGRPICETVVRSWTPDPRVPLLSSLRGSGRISWAAAATGAFIGTYSHVVLDSIMHADMRPFSPWSDASPLLGIVSVVGLHVACLLSGVLGALLVLALLAVRRGTPSDGRPQAGPSDTAREDARS